MAADHAYNERMRRARIAVLTILGLSIGMFIVIAVLATLNEGLDKFVATLESINPLYYSAALVCVLLSTIVGFPKWDMFVKKLGIHIPWQQNFAIYQSMFSMDITPGRWGRAVVAYTINRITGLRFGKTFPAVVADILTDFLGFISVAIVTSFLVRSYTLVSIVISVLLLIPFFFIYVRAPYEWVKRKLGVWRRLRGVFKTADIYFRSSRSLDAGTYLYAMIFTIPSVILSSLALYFVILSFGIALAPDLIPTILFIYTSSLLIGMVTGIPGTLGVTDAAMLGYLIAFFGSAGLTFGIASAIIIFYRIASMWFTEGVSTGFLIYTMRYWKLRG
ncbi:MAG: flippase-like domain-containing protein [Candidatus Micrarchaeota archaeon]|nr:flippase-like domain-containing protein [Candidatus Micrarchaeota archaeon]